MYKPSSTTKVELIDLHGAFLQGAEIRDVHLVGPVLDGADLAGTRFLAGSTIENAVFRHLVTTDFSHASLNNCKFLGNLNNIDFSHSKINKVEFVLRKKFRGVKFDRAEFNNVIFREVNLSECSFQQSKSTGLQILRATLFRVKFDRADLQGASLRYSSFSECSFYLVDLRHSDLRDAKGYQFDQNLISGTLLSRYAADDWSTLRRTYTGARMVFTLIFLAIFFTPLAFRAQFWVEVNHFQTSLHERLSMIKESANQLLARSDPASREIGRFLSQVASIKPCLSTSCEKVSLLSILLGQRSKGFGRVIIPALLAYNILRAILTYFVSQLRYEEEISGRSPSCFSPEHIERHLARKRLGGSAVRRRLRKITRKFPGLRFAEVVLDLIMSVRHPALAVMRRISSLWHRVAALWDRVNQTYSWMIKVHKLVLGLGGVAMLVALVHIGQLMGSSVSLPASSQAEGVLGSERAQPGDEMIRTLTNSALRDIFRTGSTTDPSIPSSTHLDFQYRLDLLDNARSDREVSMAGISPRPSPRPGCSEFVYSTWRIVYRWNGTDADDVDLG